jgi:Double sensory domain of two-component sensor kinase
MRNLSIKLKLAVAVVLCLGAVAVANAAMARQRYRQDLAYAGEQAVSSAARSFESMERRELDKLSSTLDALIGDPTLTAFFAQRDFDRLYAAAAPIFQDLKDRHSVTDWEFIEPQPARTVFLRVHRPELHSDLVDRPTVLTAIRTNDTVAGKELDRTGFALRVVRPFVVHGKLLGYMELGQQIDDFLRRMKAETGDEFGLVVQKRYVDEKAWVEAWGARRNNWNDDPEVVAVEVTSADAPVLGSAADARDVPDGGRSLALVERGGKLFVRGVVPARDLEGHSVGGLFVLHDVTALRDRSLGERNRSILLICFVALAVLGLLLAMVEWLVFRRLAAMSKAMEDVSMRLAGGDYEVGATVQPAANDEIGKFEGFLGSFLGTIGATLREMEKRRRRP